MPTEQAGRGWVRQLNLRQGGGGGSCCTFSGGYILCWPWLKITVRTRAEVFSLSTSSVFSYMSWQEKKLKNPNQLDALPIFSQQLKGQYSQELKRQGAFTWAISRGKTNEQRIILWPMPFSYMCTVFSIGSVVFQNTHNGHFGLCRYCLQLIIY